MEIERGGWGWALARAGCALVCGLQHAASTAAEDGTMAVRTLFCHRKRERVTISYSARIWPGGVTTTSTVRLLYHHESAICPAKMDGGRGERGRERERAR